MLNLEIYSLSRALKLSVDYDKIITLEYIIFPCLNTVTRVKITPNLKEKKKRHRCYFLLNCSRELYLSKKERQKEKQNTNHKIASKNFLVNTLPSEYMYGLVFAVMHLRIKTGVVSVSATGCYFFMVMLSVCLFVCLFWLALKVVLLDSLFGK